MLLLEHRLRVGELFLGPHQLLLLGLHRLGDARVRVHRAHPHAQGLGRLGDLAHLVGQELGVVDVLLDALDLLLGDVVLVVVLQRFEEVALRHHLLGFAPVRLDALKDAHRLESEHDELGRLLVRLDLVDVVLVERLERLDRRVVGGHRLVEVPLGVGGNGLRLLGDLAHLRLLLGDARLDFVGVGLVDGHLLEQLGGVDARLLEHRLQVGQLLLELRDDGVGLDELGHSARVAVNLQLHRGPLLREHRRVQVEQLEVRGRRRVGLPAHLREEGLAAQRHRIVHLDADVAHRIALLL